MGDEGQRLAAGELDPVAERLKPHAEDVPMISLDREHAPLARATCADGLLNLPEKGVEVGLRPGKPGDDGQRLPALAGFAAVEANEPVVGHGGRGDGFRGARRGRARGGKAAAVGGVHKAGAVSGHG